MAFNSMTYHANKHRKLALKALADARAAKARDARGERSQFETEQVCFLARSALSHMRLSRCYRMLTR